MSSHSAWHPVSNCSLQQYHLSSNNNNSSGNWTTTGSINNARYQHTASVLTDRKVLVTGGYSGTGALNSTELYDPSTGTWSTTVDMNDARFEHTACVFPSQKTRAGFGRNTPEIAGT
jgi:hypothetical protein